MLVAATATGGLFSD